MDLLQSVKNAQMESKKEMNNVMTAIQLQGMDALSAILNLGIFVLILLLSVLQSVGMGFLKEMKLVMIKIQSKMMDVLLIAS